MFYKEYWITGSRRSTVGFYKLMYQILLDFDGLLRYFILHLA
jgi:hypothetical protein